MKNFTDLDSVVLDLVSPAIYEEQMFVFIKYQRSSDLAIIKSEIEKTQPN